MLFVTYYQQLSDSTDSVLGWGAELNMSINMRWKKKSDKFPNSHLESISGFQLAGRNDKLLESSNWKEHFQVKNEHATEIL